MAKVKTMKKVYDVNAVFKDIAAGITDVGVFFLLVFFPLFTHDAYFDILGARYVFFKIIVIVMMILMFLLVLAYLFIDNSKSTYNTKGGAFDRLVDSIRPENFKKHVIATDVFFAIMIIAAAISTRFSLFPSESFFGNSGRYQGLECWLMYFMLYIMISRTFRYNRLFLDFAILAGVFACLWSVADYFYIDLFGFFVNVSAHQRNMFTSSVGNLDTYTNYATIVFALSSTLFLIEKNNIKAVFYAICAFVSSIGCLVGFADNTVIGMGVFFLVAPLIALRDKRNIIRYFYLAAIFFFSISCFRYMGMVPSLRSWAESFFLDLSRIFVVRLLWIIPFIVAIILSYCFRKRIINSNDQIITVNVMDEECPKFIHRTWLIVLTVFTAFIVFIFVDVNVTKIFTNIWYTLPSSHQLIISDDWGTHRGHNWRIAFTNFIENFNWFQRFFGYGPETYLVVTERTFYYEMVNRYGEVYDSAHNEYIHYLICFGIVGLISYLGIFISGIRYTLKMAKENMDMCVIALAVIAYMAQAVVNIAIPITTPVFFTLMYTGVAYYIANKDELIDINSNVESISVS